MDFRDLTATIIDLAVRGYLRIEVSEEKHLFGLISTENVVFHRTSGKSAAELAAPGWYFSGGGGGGGGGGSW